MTHSLEKVVEELQGRPCSPEELNSLNIWARSRIHWSARVVHALVRSRGYLMQVNAEPFSHPKWYGLDFEELQRGLEVASTA